MSALAAPDFAVQYPVPAGAGVTPGRAVTSEWIKFRTLRSTWFSLGAAVVVTIGLGVLIAALRGNDAAAHGVPPDVDWTRLSLGGVLLAQLAVGVLGVMMITGEYSTGMIRASLSAVPGRPLVLAAKVSVLAATAFIIGTLATLVAFLGGQAALSAHHFGVSLTSPGVLRAIIGGGVYLALIGLLGLGCGFILRNTGGALATLFGLLLVLPLLAQALPSSFQDHVAKFLPLNAGVEVMSTVHHPDVLSPLAGIATLAVWAAVALGIGLITLRRRDA
jgi:ABC-2 type transport system permease protein